MKFSRIKIGDIFEWSEHLYYTVTAIDRKTREITLRPSVQHKHLPATIVVLRDHQILTKLKLNSGECNGTNN